MMKLVDSEFQFKGQCVGGPMDEQGASSRYPDGFILIDRVNDRCWIYDYDRVLQIFKCRNDAGDTLDHARRFKTAYGTSFEVRSVA